MVKATTGSFSACARAMQTSRCKKNERKKTFERRSITKTTTFGCQSYQGTCSSSCLRLVPIRSHCRRAQACQYAVDRKWSGHYIEAAAFPGVRQMANGT